MSKSFSELRQQSSNIDKIRKQVESSEGKKSYEDNRFWQAQLDKAGNGQADIRFLPQPPGEDDSWVKIWSHGFQGPGGWYIEACPTTIGLECPVCAHNSELVATHGKDDGVKRIREKKSARKLHYISNILVVNDPANPDNNGKVFLFKYGQKIHKKFLDALSPPSELDEAYNPASLDDGANFKLRIAKVEGFANFDASIFATRGPVKLGKDVLTDEQLEAIWKQEYGLKEFVDPVTKFKSYDDLEKNLKRVLGPKDSVSGKTIEESLKELEPLTPKSVDAKPAEELERVPQVDTTTDADDIEALRALIK